MKKWTDCQASEHKKAIMAFYCKERNNGRAHKNSDVDALTLSRDNAEIAYTQNVMAFQPSPDRPHTPTLTDSQCELVLAVVILLLLFVSLDRICK
jgi:hypothetical protein